MGKKKIPAISAQATPNPLEGTSYSFLLDKSSDPNRQISGDLGATYIPGGLDKYTRDISPWDVSNIDDYRGERQSTGEKWKNGIVKAIGKTGLRVADGFATIPYILGAGYFGSDKGYLESIYNNPFSVATTRIIDQLNESLPNYYTQEEQDSLAASLAGANFWADKFLDGASYAAAAYITGRLSGNAITGMRNVFANGAKGAGLLQSATTLDDAIIAANELQRQSGTVRKVGDFFQQAASTTIASAFESSQEARETYNSVKDQLIQQKLSEKIEQGDNTYLTEEELAEINEKAVSAGNINFGMNMMLTGATNYLQFGKYFSNAKASNTFLNSDRILGELGNSSVRQLSRTEQFFSRYGKPIYENIISEAGQEVGQLASNELLVDYYTAKNQDSEQLSKSFLEAMHTSFMTKEGWESALLGAFIGGGTMIGGKIGARFSGQLSESQQQEKALADAVAIRDMLPTQINNFIGNGLHQLNTSTELTKQQMEAAKRGDKFSYLGLSALDLHTMVSGAIESNSFEDYIANLESAKDLTEDQFKTQFGVTSISNKNEFIDETIEKSNKLKQSYDKIKQVHGHKLNNQQIGVVSTVAAIADDAAARQNQIFEKLKTDYNFDLREAIFNRSVGFNRDFNVLNDLNSQLNQQKQNQERTNNFVRNTSDKTEKTRFKNELRAINDDIARLTNDIETLTFDENQIVDEQNYRDQILRLSTQTRNQLDEKARRGRAGEILNPTNREEFTSLLIDFNRLENIKSEFIQTYNALTSESYQKNFAELEKKIEDRNNKNETDALFTIKTPASITSTDDNGNTQETIDSENLVLNQGIYTGNVTQDSYVQDGESIKVETPNNLYEIKERRVRQTQGGKPIPEVLVSINGAKDKWIPVSQLKFKKLQQVPGNDLSAEMVFYNKYKNRLITVEYNQGFSNDEISNIQAANLQRIEDNEARISAGEEINVNDGVISGGRTINGKPVIKTVSGFLGLDRQGRPTLRVWNEQTETFEQLQDKYLTETDENGNQLLTSYSFKVSSPEINEPGYYQPSSNYTIIASKEMSNRYLMSKFIGKRIDEIQKQLDDLLANDEIESAKKELDDVKREIRKTKNNLSKTIGDKAQLLTLNELLNKLDVKRDELIEKTNQQKEALDLLKTELAELQKQQQSGKFTEGKLIKEIKSLGISKQLNGQLIVDYIQSKHSDTLQIMDVLDRNTRVLKSNIASTLLYNYGSSVDNLIQEAGLDPTVISDFEKLDFITSDLKSVLERLGVEDFQLQSEVEEALDLQAHLNSFEDALIADINENIRNNSDYNFPFDSVKELMDYAAQNNIESDLLAAFNPLEAERNLKIAALESELAAFYEIKRAAFYDQRLQNKGKRSHTIRNEDYTEDELETSDELDSVTETDNKAPDIFHNGDFTLEGLEHIPFMKSTNPNVDSIQDSDDNTTKSKFIFNNVVTLLDKNEYFVEITNQLADIQNGDVSKYPVSEKAKGSLYTIIVDKNGNRVKFNSSGQVDPNGLIAHGVLPTSSLQTKTDEGIVNNRFRGIENLTDSQQEALKQSQIKFKALRQQLHNKINKGDRVFYNINSKSLGIKKTGQEQNRLSKVLNYDFKNPEERLIIGTGLQEYIGDGDIYPTYPGKFYYINEKTKQVVPLKTRKINSDEIDNIINALIYFNNNNTPEASQDNIINAISTYLLWGPKPKAGNAKYEIYFTPDTNATQLTFSGFYRNEDGNLKKITKTINLNDLENDTQERQDFANFLSGINKQVYSKKLGRAVERRRIGTPNKYIVRQFNRTEFTDVEYSDYINYQLESDESSLSSNMIRNSNSGDGIIKSQWVGAYVRLGNETQLENGELKRDSIIEPEIASVENTPEIISAEQSLQNAFGIAASKITKLQKDNSFGKFIDSITPNNIDDDITLNQFKTSLDLYLTAEEKNKLFDQYRKNNISDNETFKYLFELIQKGTSVENKLIDNFITSYNDFVEKTRQIYNTEETKKLQDEVNKNQVVITQPVVGDKFSDFEIHKLNNNLFLQGRFDLIESASKEDLIRVANTFKNDKLKQKILDNIDEIYKSYQKQFKNQTVFQKILRSVPVLNSLGQVELNILGLPQINDDSTLLRTLLQASVSQKDIINKLKSVGTPYNNLIADKVEFLSGKEIDSLLSELEQIYIDKEGFVRGLSDIYNKLQDFNRKTGRNAKIISSLDANNNSIRHNNFHIEGLTDSNKELSKYEIIVNVIQQVIDDYSNQERLKLDGKPYEEVDFSSIRFILGADIINDIKSKVDDRIQYGDQYDVESDTLLTDIIADFDISQNDLRQLANQYELNKLTSNIVQEEIVQSDEIVEPIEPVSIESNETVVESDPIIEEVETKLLSSENIKEQLTNKLNNEKLNLVGLNPERDLLAYILQTKDLVSKTNINDRIKNIKGKLNNYLLDNLDENINITTEIESELLINSIDELFSIDPNLTIDIIKNNAAFGNSLIWQHSSDNIINKTFGTFNIENTDLTGIEDLSALNNKQNISVYDTFDFDDVYGIVNNQLYKKLSSNQYVKLDFKNSNLRNWAFYNVRQSQEIENTPVDPINNLKPEDGNC